MIRRMTHADTDALAELERICFSPPWTKAQLEEECDSPRARFFVYEENGEPVGYIGAWRVCDEYEMANFAVFPKVRRKGYGGKLLAALLEAGEKEGIRAVSLEVRRSNESAVALYEKFGFCVEGVRTRYYQDGEDAVIMWKRKE